MNQLTTRQLEILGVLQEECAEVIQIISKIRRFGLDSVNPYDPEHLRCSNLVKLHDELGDVQGMIDMLSVSYHDYGPMIDQEAIKVRARRKITKVEPFLTK